jgi:hypothetical protein
LTPAQRAYVQHYLNTLLEGLVADMDPDTGRELVIDMDAVADQGTDQPRPEFYYTAETQQTRYRCDHCDDFNDIRGRYGYCASCGWRNNIQSLHETFEGLRERLNGGQTGPIDTVKSAVSEFDAACRDMIAQIRKRVPIKPGRKAELERVVFHDVDSTLIRLLKTAFEIDLFRGMDADISFLRKMTHRRHIFEHNAGVADERYVRESGDAETREGVLIRETQANAHQLIACLNRAAENLDKDFHEIFPATEWPIHHHQQRRRARQRP